MTPAEIEAAAPEQTREALEAVFRMTGRRTFERSVWYSGDVKGWSFWDRFETLLDAEAYLDAAIMLVPEGFRWTVSTEEPGPYAWVGEPGSNIPAQMAATPTLALLAAIVRAMEGRE